MERGSGSDGRQVSSWENRARTASRDQERGDDGDHAPDPVGCPNRGARFVGLAATSLRHRCRHVRSLAVLPVPRVRRPGRIPHDRLRPRYLRPGGACLLAFSGADRAAEGCRLQHLRRPLPPDHRGASAVVLALGQPPHAADRAGGTHRGVDPGRLPIRPAARRRGHLGADRRGIRLRLADPIADRLRLP